MAMRHVVYIVSQWLKPGTQAITLAKMHSERLRSSMRTKAHAKQIAQRLFDVNLELINGLGSGLDS